MNKKFLFSSFLIMGSGIFTTSMYFTFLNKTYSPKFIDLFSESHDLTQVSEKLGWDIFKEVGKKPEDDKKKSQDFLKNSVYLKLNEDILKNNKNANERNSLKANIENLKEKIKKIKEENTNLGDDFYKKVERFSELAVQSNQKIEKLDNLNSEINRNFNNVKNKIDQNFFKTPDFEKVQKTYIEIVELEGKIVEAKYLLGVKANDSIEKTLKQQLLEKIKEQEKNFEDEKIVKYKNELKTAFDLLIQEHKNNKLIDLIYFNNIDIGWKYGFVEPRKIKK